MLKSAERNNITNNPCGYFMGEAFVDGSLVN